MAKTTTDPYAESAELFRSDTKDHELTILHDDGLYRHLRFRRPETGMYWFDLITWPGALAVVGDFGTGYTFRRIDDMFEFFRESGYSNSRSIIHPHYWSEKIASGKDGVREYSEELFRQRVAEELDEYDKAYPGLRAKYESDLSAYEATPFAQRYPMSAKGPRRPAEPATPKSPAEIREELQDHGDDGMTQFEDCARDLLRQWERDGWLEGTFEWELTTWSWHFLWAYQAIREGVRQYDAAKAAVPATTS